jgi:hypothetical protein
VATSGRGWKITDPRRRHANLTWKTIGSVWASTAATHGGGGEPELGWVDDLSLVRWSMWRLGFATRRWTDTEEEEEEEVYVSCRCEDGRGFTRATRRSRREKTRPNFVREPKRVKSRARLRVTSRFETSTTPYRDPS